MELENRTQSDEKAWILGIDDDLQCTTNYPEERCEPKPKNQNNDAQVISQSKGFVLLDEVVNREGKCMPKIHSTKKPVKEAHYFGLSIKKIDFLVTIQEADDENVINYLIP